MADNKLVNEAAALFKAETEKFFQLTHKATETLLADPEMVYFSGLKKMDNAFNLAVSFSCVFQGDVDRNDYTIEIQSQRALATLKTNWEFSANGKDAREGITTPVRTDDTADRNIARIFVALAEIDPVFGEHYAKVIEPDRPREREASKIISKPAKPSNRKPIPV